MINLASNKRRDFLYIASLPLSVLIPVIVLLLFNNEPLLSFVSIILYFIITSITIALMLLISSLFKNKQHIVLSLIVFFFIYTMFFPTQALKTDLIPYGEIGSAVAILIFLISLFSLLKQHIVKLVFLMLSITLLLTICFPDRSPREIQEQVYASPKNLSSSPNKRYVHIILDQHIGIDGLIINNNQDKQYVDSLYDNYDTYNFDLYPKAY